MKTELGLNRCLTYINCEIQPPTRSRLKNRKFKAVTISRQTGSGAHVVAECLRKKLQAAETEPGCPWTVFDKNLVEKVLDEHNLPARLARFMTEDRISEMSDTIDELFGLHPPSWSLVRDVSETILHLAERGNVIIIGRGANVIAAKLDSVLHVRLVGSKEKRAEHLQEARSLSGKAALDLLRREDRARARYLKKYLDTDVENPLLYHMILNTDLIGYDEAAEMIAGMVLVTKKEHFVL
jgi:cytidylate kinase